MKNGMLTFLEFAYDVLSKTKTAMTPDEIWKSPLGEKLKPQIKTTGKTPLATLGARLYTDVKADDSKFVAVGSRPTRFAVKGIDVSGTQQAATPATAPQKSSFLEKDLHPLLVWFARQQFSAWCKTIPHSQSINKQSGSKSNQWLHPDIVGFTLLTKSWERPVADLLRTTGASATKLYSFELKCSLEFGTLREHFFQAVSNSSWANAGYLVAAELTDTPEFMEELGRLSQSFGIGVIKLDLESLEEESRILFPAQEKKEVDWETINRIAEINPIFREFLTLVRESSDIHKIVNETTFDEVKDTDEMIANALSLTKKQGRRV